MTYLLNIHTATETALLNLTAGTEILGTRSNHETKQHAAFLHTAIQELLAEHHIDIKNLNAIGVTSGPGSYTGIRVGLAAAKGLCYALKIPLITFNSLEVMAISATDFIKDKNAFYCPMIDARRQEVYAALYDFGIAEITPPSAIILNENSFAQLLDSKKIFFSGSGSDKFQHIINHPNAIFTEHEISTEALAKIAFAVYKQNKFTNIPYAQPLYIK